MKFFRKRMAMKTRATLGFIAIAATALWALKVSYDIPLDELLSFLFGSLFVLVAAMLFAAFLVLCVKLVAGVWHRLAGGARSRDRASKE